MGLLLLIFLKFAYSYNVNLDILKTNESCSSFVKDLSTCKTNSCVMTIDESSANTKEKYTLGLKIKGKQDNLCSIYVAKKKEQQTDLASFQLTDLEITDLSLFIKELTTNKKVSVSGVDNCCAKNSETKSLCKFKINGKELYDTISEEPYFDCNGKQVFKLLHKSIKNKEIN